LEKETLTNEERIAELERELAEQKEKNARLRQEMILLQDRYDIMSTSECWRSTAPIRFVLDTIKSKLRRFNQSSGSYEKVKNRMIFSEKELQQQREEAFPRKLTISIVVPLYNTPEKFLREMIESVLDQTYTDWELCLADGSDDEHKYVEKLCSKYCEKDARIKYKKLEKNLGISGNTNEALNMTTGQYIALFDHDDLLHPAALYEVMQAICDGDPDFIYTDECSFVDKPEDGYLPHFKPDYAPDNLLAYNYICHLSVFSRELYEKVGGFRSQFDGSQDHDFILRATEAANCIAHIPEVLYFWRNHEGSVASGIDAKSYAVDAGIAAVSEHIKRLGRKAMVKSSAFCPTQYDIVYELSESPLVSIIIPNYEHKDDLKKCIDSIYERSTYKNFEIVIVENNSKSKEIFAYYDLIKIEHNNIKVVNWSGKFNFSAICNYGVSESNGEVLLFLNNDTEVITSTWLEEMLSYATRKDVGAVGAKLFYPNNLIQHAGVLIACGGVASHYYCQFPRDAFGYMRRLTFPQNQSAVTGACLMMRRSVFDEIKGFDEGLAVAFNDVDLCMKVRTAGYLIVWTPNAQLYHYESISRGRENTAEKKARFESEVKTFQKCWSKELVDGDPYFNPNFEKDNSCFWYKPVGMSYPARYTYKK